MMMRGVRVGSIVGRRFRTVIATEDAPAAIGPYSQAIKANGFLYVSGVLGLNPKTMQFPADTAEAQTAQIMTNMCAVLKAGGSSPSKVIKTTVLLADMDDFPTVNAIYKETFNEDPPARACYAVKTLPMNAKVEIEVIALSE